MPEPDVPELDVGAVLGALERRGVKFVLIGGMAGVVHGSPFPTEDIDITPERSQENLARLSSALTDLDARVRPRRGCRAAAVPHALRRD
jgi:hypothetical protein